MSLTLTLTLSRCCTSSSDPDHDPDPDPKQVLHLEQCLKKEIERHEAVAAQLAGTSVSQPVSKSVSQ